MMLGRRAQIIAVIGALAVFLVLLVGLRLRGWPPFILAALAYAALLWVLPRPPARAPPAPLPDGISRADQDAALAALENAVRDLRSLAERAPSSDRARLRHMAALIDAIRKHHLANPSHLARTRIFVRHTLPRMVGAIATYVDLASRALAQDEARLAGIRERLDGFIPVLEQIERACLDHDLTALEISVEVLDEQLGRDGRFW